MKDDSLIKELFDHFDELNYGFRPNTREYDIAVSAKNDSYDKLREAIPEKHRFLLDDYVDMDTDVVLLELKEVYRQGVCFGVKLVSEAFVTNKNRATIHGDK